MNAKVSNLWVGWHETNYASEIEHLVQSGWSIISQFPYVLITWLDSDHQLSLEGPSISECLEQDSALDIHQLGDSWLLSLDSLTRLVKTFHFFNGFDEVWFLTSRPSAAPSKELRLDPQGMMDKRSGGAEIENTITELERWMKENHAVLGVDDGTGFGFVTNDEMIFRQIEVLAKSQDSKGSVGV